MVSVTVGSAFLGIVRGILTVRDRLAAVGLILVAENAVRCVLAAVLIAGDVTAARYYGLALAAGQLVGFGWPSALRLGRTGPTDQGWLRFVAGASGGQVIAQVVLTGGPVALALLGGTPAEVTGLFVALALFRAPYTLALGAVSPATGVAHAPGGRRGARRRSAGSWRARGAHGSRRRPRRCHRLVRGTRPAAARLRRLDRRLTREVCLLIAVGSALSLGTLLLSLVAMAHDRSHTTLRSWLDRGCRRGRDDRVGPGTPAHHGDLAFLVAEAGRVRDSAGHRAARREVRRRRTPPGYYSSAAL